MKTPQKRYKKLIKIWEEIHEILDKNHASMDTYKGSIAIYDLEKRPGNEHSIVIKEMKEQGTTQIFNNIPF